MVTRRRRTRRIIAGAALGAVALGGGVAVVRNTGPAHQCVGPRVDRSCTPGALNPAVTQATIRMTICVPGYTKTVRPPVSYTSKVKTERMTAYGYKGRDPKGFELDHLVALELGGAPRDVKNLWPEPYPAASVKDRTENALHAQVCAGTITLRAAQAQVRAAG